MHRAVRYAATAGGAVALLWGGAVWLQPLTTIVPTMGRLVSTTQEILGETRALQVAVGRVQTNLKELDRQERLLAEQEELTRAVLSQLTRQEELGGSARGLLTEILHTEQTTADLIHQADRAGAQSLATVSATARELGQLAVETARIQSGSQTLDTKVDRLLVEMQGSADNFAIIGRVKSGTTGAVERTKSWWNKVLEWFHW